MPGEPQRTRTRAGAIALIAASTLIFEVLLTRVSALRLDFHYSYLVVANALLGVGLAGALLYVLKDRIQAAEDRWLRGLVGIYALSLPLAYAFMLTYPVPYDVRVSTGERLLSFLAFNLGAAVPMFFGGASIGLILMARAASVHRLYAADLFGAAAGCAVCPLLLWMSGAGGALACAVALALAALAASSLKGPRHLAALGAGGAALSLAAAPFVDARFPVPSKAVVLLASNESFDLRGRAIESRWSAISRVDVVEVPPEERRLFLRGPTVEMPRPEAQAYVMQDGTAGTYIHDYTGTPAALEGLRRSLYSLGARVLQPRSTLVIGVGGGDDLWAQYRAQVPRIKGIELNRQILDVHRTSLRAYSKDLIERSGVELVHGEGRTALLRETERFGLLQMSGIDTWTALQSGAYMLAENFLYTEEAIADMFRVLEPDGALQISRFSGDHEAIRLLATLRGGWMRQHAGEGLFEDCVVCVPSHTQMSILVKRSPLRDGELDRLDEFLEESRLTAVYHPRRELGGALETYVRSTDPEAIIDSAVTDLRPVPDDRPYFFNFVRWNDLGRARATLDAAVTVTQGNPLFLFGQLAAALLVGLVLLGAPLALSRGRVRKPSGEPHVLAVGAYFAAVGAGFITAEIGLIQKLVLLLGHPVYSVSVTLASMLLATGTGAYLSRNRFRAPTLAIWWVPLALALSLGLLAAFDAQLVRSAAPLPATLRFAVAALVVAPVGLAVGVPFSHGLALLERTAPRLVPWAWATNAVATVVGSIATVILSMNFGFRMVFVASVALYALAALTAGRLVPGSGHSAES